MRTPAPIALRALATWAAAIAALALGLVGCQPAPDAAACWPASDAEAQFQAGANRRPTVATLYSLARVLSARGRDAECSGLLRRIIKDHPGFMPAYYDLAEIQMRSDKVDAAAAVLREGLRASPRDPALLNNLGMCCMFGRDYQAALDMFARAAAAAADSGPFRANMAVALGMMGRYDESARLYEQVVSPAEVHHNLGVLCEARKDLLQAACHYGRARDLGLARADAARQGPAPGQVPAQP